MKKTFVLRSHCLIRTSDATLRFDSDNEIVIPEPVLHDLNFIAKDFLSEKGVLARQVLEYLDSLDTKQLYSKDGVKQSNGSIIRVVNDYSDEQLVPLSTPNVSANAKAKAQPAPKDPKEKLDYRCLQIALGLSRVEKKTVILVTQNPLMRMKAKNLGIKAESFKDELFPPLKDQYSGRVVGQVSLAQIREFKEKGFLNPKSLRNFKDITFYPNMFIILQDFEKTLPTNNIYETVIGRFNGKHIVKLKYQEYHPFKTTEKTVGQIMLKEALMESPEKAPVVIVKGNAGTGKTFETLAVALDQLEEGVYDQIVVTAPTETVGQERLGFLPGGIDAKFDPHIGGIKDNVRILHINYKGKKFEAMETAYTEECNKSENVSNEFQGTENSSDSNSGNGNKRKDKNRQRNNYNNGNNNNGKNKNPIQAAFDEQRRKLLDGSYLFENQTIVIQPIGYLRGRTFLRTLFIIDETQNIMPPIIKSIITREGIGSKFVFLGDPTQIDNPELNERFNGLTFFGERTKDDEDIWLVTLTEDESVRSKIAKKMAMYL